MPSHPENERAERIVPRKYRLLRPEPLTEILRSDALCLRSEATSGVCGPMRLDGWCYDAPGCFSNWPHVRGTR